LKWLRPVLAVEFADIGYPWMEDSRVVIEQRRSRPLMMFNVAINSDYGREAHSNAIESTDFGIGIVRVRLELFSILSVVGDDHEEQDT
jgi:hypothetical protein